MALATRANSGLIIKVDRRGRMYLYCHGHRIPSFGIDTISEGMRMGETIVRLPTFAITFENYEGDPTKDDPLDAERTS